MYSVNFEGATHKLTAPDCNDLPARRTVYESGRIAWETHWYPTIEELDRLNKGEPVVLTILGDGHPPVKLQVLK